jgi:hypothetical protein
MKWKKAKCYPLESIGYMYVDDQVRIKLDDKSKKILWAMIKSLNDTSFTFLMKEILWLIELLNLIKKNALNWKVDDSRKYDFLPILDEEEKIYKDHLEPIVTPP